jgi:DHA2 family multidrug resistance protein
VNVPIGVVAVALSVGLLRDFGYRDTRPFDTLGFVLAGGGLAILLLGVSESESWGWASPRTLGSVLAGFVLLTAFTRHELRTPDPMIEVRIFRIPVFTIGLVITMFVTVAQFTRLVFIPLELETLRGTTAFQVGLLLSPGAIAAGIAMLMSGRLVDRIGPRTPVVVGTSLMCVSVLAMANLTTHTPLWAISALLVDQGIGMGLSSVPSTVVALNALPPKYVAQATAARTVSSQAAGAIGIGALAALVAARMAVGSAQAAYNSAFLASGALLVIAIVLGTRLPRRPERMGAASIGILPE